MRIALVKCPWWVRYCPPYILAFFSTLLRNKGHEVSVFDMNNSLYYECSSEYRKYWDNRDYYSLWENPSFVEQLFTDSVFKENVKKITSQHPGMVCFTTHTPNTLISLELARKIKETDSDIVTVFMGHKASRAQMAFDFIAQDHVDYVCTGEADIALPELIEKLEGGNDKGGLPRCPGFLVKEGKDIIDCGDPQVVSDLDALLFPEYDDFTEDMRTMPYSQPGRIDILDSRGCINDCHFCYERLFWQKYRTMSGRRLFEQITYHIDKMPETDYFYFNGLLLNGSLKVLDEFCELVLENSLSIRWAGQAMIRKDMTPELLKKMNAAGCEWLYFGVESGSGRVLEKMNKRHRPEEAVEVLKNTYEAGINAQINIVFGFPGETEEDFFETLDFLKKVRPYINNVLASQSFCTLEKGTYLRNNPSEFGISSGDHHLYWKADKNDYALRFDRYERFCQYALGIGVPETSGVLLKKPDKWALLGDYYSYEGDHARAAGCYERSLNEEARNRDTYSKLAENFEKQGDFRRAIENYEAALDFEKGDFEAPEIIDTIKEKLEELKSIL
ncbi:MAG: radical SAM protein [Elusimicrobiota bacterium]